MPHEFVVVCFVLFLFLFLFFSKTTYKHLCSWMKCSWNTKMEISSEANQILFTQTAQQESTAVEVTFE